MRNQIPPPVIALFLILIMFLSTWFIQPFHFVGQKVFSIFILIEAVLIIFFSIKKFKKFNTTINPFKPEESSYLIQSGIYNFTRNPMYLGLSSIQLGCAIYLGAWFGLIFIPLFILYITKFQIEVEEFFLEKKFGIKYIEYKKSVRRWV